MPRPRDERVKLGLYLRYLGSSMKQVNACLKTKFSSATFNLLIPEDFGIEHRNRWTEEEINDIIHLSEELASGRITKDSDIPTFVWMWKKLGKKTPLQYKNKYHELERSGKVQKITNTYNGIHPKVAYPHENDMQNDKTSHLNGQVNVKQTSTGTMSQNMHQQETEQMAYSNGSSVSVPDISVSPVTRTPHQTVSNDTSFNLVIHNDIRPDVTVTPSFGNSCSSIDSASVMPTNIPLSIDRNLISNTIEEGNNNNNNNNNNPSNSVSDNTIAQEHLNQSEKTSVTNELAIPYQVKDLNLVHNKMKQWQKEKWEPYFTSDEWQSYIIEMNQKESQHSVGTILDIQNFDNDTIFFATEDTQSSSRDSTTPPESKHTPK